MTAVGASEPRSMRVLLSALGVQANRPDSDGALASYLLFERAYTRRLMALGRSDALARRAEICAFFGWHDSGNPVRMACYA